MDATFWATVALVIFLGIAIYMNVPGTINKSLDSRATKISAELNEAQRLREDAEQLLADYQRRREDAEKEAGEIVAAARREADQLVEEARLKTEDYVTRRTRLAEQKIGQAEREAINEVRSRAVDIAIDAARRLVGTAVDAKTSDSMFQASLRDLKAKLN